MTKKVQSKRQQQYEIVYILCINHFRLDVTQLEIFSLSFFFLFSCFSFIFSAFVSFFDLNRVKRKNPYEYMNTFAYLYVSYSVYRMRIVGKCLVVSAQRAKINLKHNEANKTKMTINKKHFESLWILSLCVGVQCVGYILGTNSWKMTLEHCLLNPFLGFHFKQLLLF